MDRHGFGETFECARSKRSKRNFNGHRGGGDLVQQDLPVLGRGAETRGQIDHAADQAMDGVEGIRLAAEINPALILLDIQLPGMDGYAIAHELRTNDALTNIPIVAVTSHAMVGDRERILAAGCSDYIEKPIDPETFIHQVEQHL